jgi:SAM-dependent methyltransferase
VTGKRLLTALKYTRDYGIQKTFDYATHQFSESWYERRLGLSTSRVVELSQFGIVDSSLREYRPLAYLTIRRVLAQVPVSQRHGAFLDFGSGMGRVLILAARAGFQHVVGIELIESLNAIARQNIQSAARHLAGAQVQVVTTDARLFEIPPSASVFFFYNPFGGQVLSDVFANIRASLSLHPRSHTIIYVRPPKTGAGWVGEQAWLTERRRMAGYRGEEVFYFEVVET